MPTLLVIDDESSILHAFRRVFDDPDITLLTAQTAGQGVEMVKQHHPDVVILDVNLPDRSGLEAFQSIHEFDARIPVIFVTGHGSTDTAIKAIQLGAFDYIFKPLRLDDVRELVARAFQISTYMRVPVAMPEESDFENSADLLVGRTESMNEVYKSIGRVASQDVTVLILGESGTGKELVARAIWTHSNQATKPFQAINCAAIPEALLESELFGHEKGAFTGADRRRIGRFEQVSGGALFLDEIGDMTPSMQAKVLRVLEDQTFQRVGGNEQVKTHVRLITATNRDLWKDVENGRFREDLYYRLSGYTIELPPLRERKDDIRLLAEYCVEKFNVELGTNVRKISPEAVTALQQYSWPGNVRELRGVLRRALLKGVGPVLLPEFLPEFLSEESTEASNSTRGDSEDFDSYVLAQLAVGTDDLYAKSLALMERRLLTLVLRKTKGNKLQAAKLLGITRGTLRSKMQSLELSVDDSNER